MRFDKERRRIKLGIKQLQPTSHDEYIAEHQAGETVTGRIVESSRGHAKVELGEGVFADCRLPERSEAAPAAPAAAPAADLSSLTAMLISQVEARFFNRETRPAGARQGRPDPHFPHPQLDRPRKKIEARTGRLTSLW